MPEANASPSSGYEFRVNYRAYIMHGTNYVGSGDSRYENIILYDTLKEVRENLGNYAPVDRLIIRAPYKYYRLLAVKNTMQVLFS
jgi:hypothetical protein